MLNPSTSPAAILAMDIINTSLYYTDIVELDSLHSTLATTPIDTTRTPADIIVINLAFAKIEYRKAKNITRYNLNAYIDDIEAEYSLDNAFDNYKHWNTLYNEYINGTEKKQRDTITARFF